MRLSSGTELSRPLKATLLPTTAIRSGPVRATRSPAAAVPQVGSMVRSSPHARLRTVAQTSGPIVDFPRNDRIAGILQDPGVQDQMEPEGRLRQSGRRP